MQGEAGAANLEGRALLWLAAGMDNVRNMTGSPIAGIDPHEFLDVRQLNKGEPIPCQKC